MPGKDDEIQKRLLAMFRVEAQEHLQEISIGLVNLENAADDARRAEVLDATFRAAHSLKGAARAVNVSDVEGVCQALESVFAAMKKGEAAPSAELFDLLHRSVDTLGRLLQAEEGTAGQKPPIAELIHSLHAAPKQGGQPAPEASVTPRERFTAPPAKPSGSAPDTVRVSTTRLDAVLLQAEELLTAKLAAAGHAGKLRQLESRGAEWKKKWTQLRPDLRTVQHSMNGKRNGNGGSAAAGPQLARLVRFLEWNQGFVESLQNDLALQAAMAGRDERFVAAMVDGLLEEMKKVVMQPFSTLLDVFPRFVREQSRDQGKEIALEIEGGDIEIDRRILEEMKDPMIHLVRNCIDHGIETPAERRARGKAPGGHIRISISAREGSNVELVIADDGAGIQAGKVKAAAVKQGAIPPERAEALGEQEAVQLIFESGITTSPIITDLSGRGLGLAIVKERVEKLSGVLAVDTRVHAGTTFRILLPLTLARFRGITVRCAGSLFVLPTASVERVVRVRRDEIKTVENRETISLGGQAMSLARLARVLGLAAAPSGAEPPRFHPALVLALGQQRIAFVVDEILEEQEVLVKTLGKQLARVWNIAGATVLGAGEVAPILNVPQLMKSAVKTSGPAVESPEPADAPAGKKPSVLVAEDSITSRTLLKNILETAGYEVETAVDGIDAFTKLQSGEFELVVSDVDMPRMNGFGLTAKIRGDKRFAELPVVLVTALESREDREHGIDVGASAYIVKSSFDQTNLLEVISRFL